MNHNIIFIGLDTAKEHSEVAYVEDGFQAKASSIGRIGTTKEGITRCQLDGKSKVG